MHNISIIGSGYIGLVIGLNLADFGNKVILADIDLQKIARLRKGETPIYEPGLEELLNKNLASNKIEFTSDIAEAIKSSSIIFIAVNTPSNAEGHADISAITNVANIIGKNLNEEKVICIKSTVPIGTYKIVEKIIKSSNETHICQIASIPEFLREGSALNDFINPDRIIIGTDSKKTFNLLKNIYLSTNCDPEKIIMTNNLEAETIKYVSNSFLALKVSFINEIANFCDKIGVDVLPVAKGIGLDHRIGSQFLNPGPGFGGSCFPKDILALIKMSQDVGINLELVKNSLEVNDIQKKVMIMKLRKLLNDTLSKKRITIWGLSFKSNTDDIRCSPAIDIIKDLIKENANITAYDPKAMPNMKLVLPQIVYSDDIYESVNDADALLLLTDWMEFIEADFNKIYNLMNQKIIFDTRNILNLQHLNDLGFTLETVGRSSYVNQIQNLG